MNPERSKRAREIQRRLSRPIQPAGTTAGGRTRAYRDKLTVIGVVVVVAVSASVFYRHSKSNASKRALTIAASPSEPTAGAQPVSIAPAGTSSASTVPATATSQHDNADSPLSPREVAVEHLTRGNDFLSAGKVEEAVKEFENSVRNDPESEDAQYNLAIALAKLGRDDDAIRHYEEALKILPEYAEAHNNLGNLLVKRGQLAEAIKHFNEALEFNPDSASTHNNMGTALARQGKLTDATIHFAKAVQIMPAYLDAHYNLGNAYLSQGRHDEAILGFNEALRIQPGFEPALRALDKLRQKKAP